MVVLVDITGNSHHASPKYHSRSLHGILRYVNFLQVKQKYKRGLLSYQSGGDDPIGASRMGVVPIGTRSTEKSFPGLSK